MAFCHIYVNITGTLSLVADMKMTFYFLSTRQSFLLLKIAPLKLTKLWLRRFSWDIVLGVCVLCRGDGGLPGCGPGAWWPGGWEEAWAVEGPALWLHPEHHSAWHPLHHPALTLAGQEVLITLSFYLASPLPWKHHHVSSVSPDQTSIKVLYCLK